MGAAMPRPLTKKARTMTDNLMKNVMLKSLQEFHAQLRGETTRFDKWLKECDKVVSRKLGGIGLHDLPDAAWRDYFEDGLSPMDAADCAYDDQWYDEIPSELWR